MRVLKMAAAALAAWAAFATPASATIYPIFGTPGDRETLQECATGDYMIGVRGRRGLWVDQMQIICGAVGADNTVVVSKKQPKLVLGGSGGSQEERTCKPNEVISTIMVKLTEGGQVKRVDMTCFSLKDGKSNMITFGNGNDPFRPWVGKAAVERESLTDCPAGERVAGFNVWYGEFVTGLGVVCQRFVLPAASPPPAPKPPPLASASPAQPAPVRSFAGEWAATTGQNGRFSMVLEVDGNSVHGFFVNLDGAHEYDGVLTGTISGSTLTYSYKQSVVDSTGSGTFTLSADGRSISGTGLVDDAAKTPYTWAGPYVPSFQGTWNTVTGQGGRFWLRFTIDGKSVKGSFRNRENALYNGSLEGTLSADGKTIDYTFVQVGISSRGSGQWVLSPDGRTIKGTGVQQPKDGAPIPITWTGTR